MNSGMYTPEYNPVGLYIEAGKEISKIKRCNTSKANFCFQPQGIFYITSKNKAGIATPSTFKNLNVIYASQSAPILLQNSKINKNLPTGYKMTRNGIGINDKGHDIMAIGYDVNFPEFAKYFQSQGCTDAMFFDGGDSQILYPEKGIKANYTRTRGTFGAMIAVTD
jgi:uncharacterized protein YigE (DUF2233 family)